MSTFSSSAQYQSEPFFFGLVNKLPSSLTRHSLCSIIWAEVIAELELDLDQNWASLAVSMAALICVSDEDVSSSSSCDDDDDEDEDDDVVLSTYAMNFSGMFSPSMPWSPPMSFNMFMAPRTPPIPRSMMSPMISLTAVGSAPSGIITLPLSTTLMFGAF